MDSTKKILLIDENFYNYGEALVDHLRGRGFHVHRLCVNAFLNLKIKVYNWIIKKSQEILKLDREFPRCAEQIKVMSQRILKEYYEYQPDIVIVIKADFLNREALMKMKDSKLIVWMMDSYGRYPFLMKDLDVFDQIFVFEKDDIDLLQKPGIKAFFLPLCADERIYYPQTVTKDIDILFIGAMYLNRMKILQSIIKRFPDCNIQFYGYTIGRYEFIKRWRYNHSEIRQHFFMPISPKKANELYARSKICINIHSSQTRKGANPRTFEILAAGGFEIVDSNPYIKEQLENGVVFFDSEEDLLDKIDYYLKHEEERADIAERGYNIVREKHMFSHRIDELVLKMEDY